MEAQRKTVIDDVARKVAVQFDIDAVEKVEEILEDHGLVKCMAHEDEDEILNIEEAMKYYAVLDKAA
uniref:Uncharacterized protein n=1 Tax=Candidatus Kentrum sp. UNK TaxID=2126344 RepID=A0A451B2Z2_9GAMM|nr:MAG: hypothetical protein BECKUNK1418G_GA0071005_11164 [Candidatus Kentron sp. UNK]VFK72661.1 MAG: hypothetical protein BECKUNK1418H_GA0071006_11292 [Candidatus Kentron sp. UNK]